MDINENQIDFCDSLYEMKAEHRYEIKAELNRAVAETLFDGDEIEEDSDLDDIFSAALARTAMHTAEKFAAMLGIANADGYAMLEVVEDWNDKKESTPMTIERLRLEYEKSYEAIKGLCG